MRRLCSGFSPRPHCLRFPATIPTRIHYSTLETTPIPYQDGLPPTQQAELSLPTGRLYPAPKEGRNPPEFRKPKNTSKAATSAPVTVETQPHDAAPKDSGSAKAPQKKTKKPSAKENELHANDPAEREQLRKKALSKLLGLGDPAELKVKHTKPDPALSKDDTASSKAGPRTSKAGPESSKPGLAAPKLGRRKATRAKDRAQKDRSRGSEPVVARRILNTVQRRTKPTFALTEDMSVDSLDFQSLPLDTSQVPPLCHGLDRVLFNPGVYDLQDPRSRIYNFDPYLEKIMPVREFDFDALSPFITSSKDKTLASLAKEQGKKYSCSTSSITLVLGMFHRLLSYQRPLDISGFSKSLGPALSDDFTPFYRAPAAIFLRYKDGRYAIDPDKEFDTENILSRLGHTLEKLLTRSVDDFERYRKSSPSEVSESERNAGETYNYAKIGNFIMRSQLDASDPRLPGNGVFDLKTRAVHPIRMDMQNYEEYSDYNLRHRLGEWESFEREYYDMMRGTMLKYSLQTRIGNMDGIFVAYHNVARIFGFQYISLQEMDGLLHGDKASLKTGNAEFRLSMGLVQEVLERITTKFPSQSIRIHFDANIASAGPGEMHIFAEPYTDTEIDASNAEKDRKAREYDRFLFGSGSSGAGEALASESEEAPPASSIEGIHKGLTAPAPTSAEDSIDSDKAVELPKEWQEWTEEWQSSSSPAERELVGYRLRVDNYVKGQQVIRPLELSSESDWTIKWGIEEMKNPKPFFVSTVGKRSDSIFTPTGTASERVYNYRGLLRKITAVSREWRLEQETADTLSGRPLKVWKEDDIARRVPPQGNPKDTKANLPNDA